MHDRPMAVELLREARRLLREELLGELTGEARFKAAMVANALSMAEREIEIGEAPFEAMREELARKLDAPADCVAETLLGHLATAIRHGKFDGRADIHEFLLRSARVRLQVSNPVLLQES